MRSDAPPIIVIALLAVFFAFVAGREMGWKQHYLGEVVCQTTIDGEVLCVPADRVKKEPKP